MLKVYATNRPYAATLPQPKEKPKSRITGTTPNETPCLICECSEFRKSENAMFCTCGHHCEDHDNPHVITRKRSRF